MRIFFPGEQKKTRARLLFPSNFAGFVSPRISSAAVALRRKESFFVALVPKEEGGGGATSLPPFTCHSKSPGVVSHPTAKEWRVNPFLPSFRGTKNKRSSSFSSPPQTRAADRGKSRVTFANSKRKEIISRMLLCSYYRFCKVKHI